MCRRNIGSKVIDMVTRRKGDILSMETQNDRINIEFVIPSRGIIGLRNNVLTATAGEAIIPPIPGVSAVERGYRAQNQRIPLLPWRQAQPTPTQSTSFRIVASSSSSRRKRCMLSQVVGENAKDNDIVVNVTKSKKLTNMRAWGAGDKARIVPPIVFSLEEALEYIKEDEYVEVTPNHLRLRKIILDENERKRANRS